MKKCVEIRGDYVEKQQSYFISVTLKSLSDWKLLDPTTYIHIVFIKFRKILSKQTAIIPLNSENSLATIMQT